MNEFHDLVSLADAIANRRVSSEEATKHSIRQLRAAGAAYNCVMRINEDFAIAAARERDRELARGERRSALHGVPMAHKDMFDRIGEASSCGGRLSSQPSQQTATVIRKLDAAGVVDIGRLHMTEFAVSALGLNDHFGDCRNPEADGRISGGSSSGTAAAIASGAIHAGLGSDTGGSIRIPSAFCGVVGLKPTFGRVSRAGAAPLAASVDVVGPIGHSVADVAHVLNILAGRDEQDSCSSALPIADVSSLLAPLSGSLKIGVLDGYFTAQLDEAVATALDETLTRLREAKILIRSATFDDVYSCARHASILARGEAATLHAPHLRTRRGDYGKATWERLTGDLLLPAAVITEARRLQPYWLQNFLQNAFRDNDVLICATVPIEAPAIRDCLEGASKRQGIIGKLGWNTRIFNYLGLPALTIPAGRAPSGTPVGLQLIGRPFGEGRLLQAAINVSNAIS